MPKPNQPVAAIDPRSDVILLTYSGGPLGLGVPARDLHGGDLARIARVRALSASGGAPVDPATDAQLAALLDELVASGSFALVAPIAPIAPIAPEV